jgi:exopolysaccharide biosynthesis polyprenyl glycosylphosphotransferase
LLVCTVAIFAMSTFHRSRLRRRERRVLILGAGSGAQDLIAELRYTPEPFVPVGIVDDTDAESCAGVPVLGQLDDLPRVIHQQRPDLVVMGLERNRPAMFRHLLEHAALGFRVVEPAQFYEHAFGRVPVRDLSRAWFMSVLHLYQRPYSRAVNRVFDITISAVGMLLALPLLLVLPLLVRTTRGPVIHRQTRLGAHGKPFTMYKFRTMREDAEEGVAMWASDHDPRTTTVGRFMRRCRLDEIPQLWNVLRGDMSVVGPRPERPEFLAQLQGAVPFWDRRNLIKPGITGWAQIRRGYTADTDGSLEKLSFDLWYLRHRNLLVDVAICLQTIAFILRGDSLNERRASRLRRRPPTLVTSDLVPVAAAATAHPAPVEALAVVDDRSEPRAGADFASTSAEVATNTGTS